MKAIEVPVNREDSCPRKLPNWPRGCRSTMEQESLEKSLKTDWEVLHVFVRGCSRTLAVVGKKGQSCFLKIIVVYSKERSTTDT